MDYLACLRTFVRVAEVGSFAGIAHEVGLTPTMVGRQVSWLEARLGTSLIVRTTRRQSLTEGGRLFLDRARAVLGELQAAEESVSLMRAVPRGRLRIDAPVTFGTTILAPALHHFLSAYPEVEMDLSLNNRVVDLVEEGYDAVIRTGELPDSSLIARRLADYPLALCAAPSYLTKHGAPKRPEDLAGHACLGFHPGAHHGKWTFVTGASKDVVVQVSGPLASNSGAVLREAALAGAGLILHGEAMLAEDIRGGRLTRVMADYPPRSLPVHILYPATRSVPPKLRAFLDFVGERFGRSA
jgi:DNA-binding transcriptional LysR family regulator